MTATFKSLFKQDLLESTHQLQNHSFREVRVSPPQQRIKTNGSIVRSHSAEDRRRPSPAEDTFDHLDDLSPQLEEVEALLRCYSPPDDDRGDDRSPPVLLSDCPEFRAYLRPVDSKGGAEDAIQNEDDDEIIFGFMSREKEKLTPSCDQEGDIDGSMWERIEAEAEALWKLEQEESKIGLRKGTQLRKKEIDVPVSLKTPDHSPPTVATSVAGLLNCAAGELERLRVGAATALISFESPESPSTALNGKSEQIRKENTKSTTGPLASLLRIQLTELTRLSQTVRIEFSNQIAHEKALLELLEIEHGRVQSEVKGIERQGKAPPPDLVNQHRHLKERLEQQKTLIDDIEYRYLEDKTKYEEEKEILIDQLKLHEDTPSDSSLNRSLQQHLPIDGEGTAARSLQTLHAEETCACSTYGASSVPFLEPRTVRNPNSRGSPLTIIESSQSQTINAQSEGMGLDEVNAKALVCAPRPSPPMTALSLKSSGNNRFAPVRTLGDFIENNSYQNDPPHYSSTVFSAVSPFQRPAISQATDERKMFSSHQLVPNFHQENNPSFDETYLLGGINRCDSPQTSVSLPAGLNPLAYTSSSSSSIPLGQDHLQSSNVSSSINIFHAVPPLLSGRVGVPVTAAEDDQRLREESVEISTPKDGNFVGRRQRTTSAATRRFGRVDQERPLTRYLPVPDDISFNLRHHLEFTCGHILCSPMLMPQLHVDSTTCAGYLYKIDSRLTASMDSHHDLSSAGCKGSFEPPSTHRAREFLRVASPGSRGGFMTALLKRSRRGKRRWFVLDRRRRLLTYYSCQTSKSSSAASLMKPKDVISFTDIIDVYPDHHVGKENLCFCLLLVASCPLSSAVVSPKRHPQPVRTRILSLAAPSSEAMRVWVDALFTCAGAYLSLPNADACSALKPCQSNRNETDSHQ